MAINSAFTRRNVAVKLLVPLATMIAIAPPTQASVVTVVEYFISSNNSYFLIGRVDEQRALDGLPATFKRTGTEFDAFAAKAGPAGTQDYCRFYISDPANGVSSHF